jgi:hypothetical protein
MRPAVTLIAFCLISSCARPDYGETWPGRFTLTAGPQLGYAIKQVVEKQTPATLLADDGSVCRTSAERFSSTAEGGWIACEWTLPRSCSAPDQQ